MKPNSIEEKLLQDWFLTLELSTGCNLGCADCPQNASLKGLEIMNRDLLIDILNGLSAEGVKLSSLTPFFRGEPFYNPHFVDCLKLINHYNSSAQIFKFMTIHTNGSIQHDYSSLLAIMEKQGYGEIIFSLDTEDPSLYLQLRPGGDLAMSEKNLESMLGMYRRSAGRITVGIQFVEREANAGGFEAFRKRWSGFLEGIELGFRVILENEVVMKDQPGIYIIRKLTDERSHIGRILPGAAEITDHVLRSCHKPWMSPVIGVNGEVTFCCADVDFSLLNRTSFIQDFDCSLPRFWYSDRMKEIRASFREGKYPEKCRECMKLGMNFTNRYD